MIISIIAFIAVFSVVVLVHEFGHFIAARRAGVKVYEFSIGFPFSPKIFTFFKHKETEFTLRLLPLGGFVSFSKNGDEDAKELFEASYLNRAFIMSAGSLFNITFAFLVFVPVFVLGKHLPFLDAIALSAQTIWAVLSGTIVFVVNMFSGSGSMEGLSGPVGIASMAGQAASKGILNLAYFTGILSMSLGIMNLIPFPALDGGQLFMLLIEAVRKKPLDLKLYQMVNIFGIALFVILTIVITYRDIVRLVA
ncbi:MAG: peptidase M50 [Deltaproteobacteria bacterium GWF2_42_12]|nr:MAG: peptidase M50 [Deltaproteobacteria bacterium GWB2_42_7]OGP38183.1 MAG: peptidase M50 [Deltaproteobacteria bacterium GWD2_42_10]OGP47478.1 MAG: peptidase M50 [Deltaproteobacteria bacterium GWF2_42_12]OGQ37025.1 MAG: peptidase M50 [Deltaproteobacteria bacterium RIFCSPLOWO2_02_FULL_42_39]OGQ65874.1 MAG: peptidase M50 [Deltaproteobacteria bacterium RIFCSPLOWO2_12_FULL_42_16]OGQ73879.1 MAG: peptidase M50 [Deltaproteobacteria bacterium RIFOXYA2_FULL_42_10]